MSKNCRRRTSKNPDGYTKEELVRVAVSSLGMSKKEALSKSKEELCELVQRNKRLGKKRNCGPRKSRLNPDAYSKDELITLARDKGIKRAQKMSVSQLCSLLELDSKEGEFDYTKCSSYTLLQLRSFASKYQISFNEDTPSNELCRLLVQKEIDRLWKNCLDMRESKVKTFAKSRELSTEGSKEEICRRIFEDELARMIRPENVYENFLNDYLSAPESTAIYNKYKEILPAEYLTKFRGLSKRTKSTYISEMLESSTSDYFGKLMSLPQRGTTNSCISNSLIKLKQHQKKVVNHFKNHRGLLAVHSVGSGKTLTAVTAIQCVLEEDPKIRVLVLTPKSLQENMKKEFVTYGADPENPRIKFMSINKYAVKKKYSCKNTFLIVDEAHNLKGDQSSRAKKVIECATKVKKILLLSATPILNRPNEIVNLIGMVDGEIPMSSVQFDKFVYRNPDTLRLFLQCKISYFKAVDRSDYPSTEYHEVDIEMDKNYYKRYLEIQNSELSSLTSSLFASGKNLQVFLNGIRRASNNLESEFGSKINWVVNKIAENKNIKFLIYSTFLKAGNELIQKRLDSLKIKYGAINGSMEKEERNETVKKYNQDKIRILFISKAGAEGLDLKGTRHVVILEPLWNYASFEQVVGRAVRSGSHSHLPSNERHVDIWNLIMSKPSPRDEDDEMESADKILQSLAQKKREEIDAFHKLMEEISIENSIC